MKKLFTLLTILLITATLYAQIPNANFANWSDGSPVSWGTSNADLSGGITQSTPGYSSSTYAVKINAVGIDDDYYYEGGAIYTGAASGDFFPVTTTPATFTGWYILNSVDGDALSVSCGVKCSGNSNAGAVASDISTATSTYKQFSVTIDYTGSCTGDSATILFTLYSASGYVHSGSYAIIDNLAFSGTAGIDEVNNNTTVLEPCSPNPANNIANIIYSIPAFASVTVALYDIMGRKIKTLLDNATQSPGRYKIPADVSNLSTGMYFYSLTANGQTYTQKLAVIH
jgi:hypothetical protein